MIESKVVDSIPTLNENDCQIWWAEFQIYNHGITIY